MPYFEYDTHDELFAALRDCRRLDVAIHLPNGGTTITTAAAEFWQDVLARLRRGEWQDAVTAIERRFEPRDRAPWVREAGARGQRRAA